MIGLTDITGLAGVTVAIAATALSLPGVARLRRPRLRLVIAAVAITVLLPLGSLPAAAYVRAVFGDLSVTTIVLLALAVSHRLWGSLPADPRSKRMLQILIAVAALALYPLALGAGAFDPYRLGFSDTWFVGGALAVALGAWLLQLELITACIALAVLAYAVGWYESRNLWDYLLDPAVSIYAAVSLIVQGAKALTRKVSARASN